MLELDAVLVWVDPIVRGQDRRVLDALLRDVAASGVVVSAHPDVIDAMGTKEILYRTKDLPGVRTRISMARWMPSATSGPPCCGPPARACSSRIAGAAGTVSGGST
jgi:hypothetical protein